jgi:oligopeptide transport system permease protein
MAKKDFEMMNPNIKLSKDEATFVQTNEVLTDTKFQTKQISYFHDAFRRFAKNKGSVVAATIILFLALFSIITPFVSGHGVEEKDQYYAYALPKNPLFAGTGFWDGTAEKDVALQQYVVYHENLQVVNYSKVDTEDTNTNSYYRVRYDTYVKGYAYQSFNEEEYEKVVEYDNTVTADKKILCPMVDYETYIASAFTNSLVQKKVNMFYIQNAYLSYQIAQNGLPVYVTDKSGDAIIDETTGEVSLNRIYEKDTDGNYVYYHRTGEEGAYNYACRINYDNYVIMTQGHTPVYILGADSVGRDMMTRLASGGRLSLLLGLCVSVLNFIIGSIYGAIEGYYGGVTDLIMERISEFLSEVPTTIIFVLFNWYLKDKIPVIFLLFFAFVFVGWLGTASTVRMQFYRYKNQEYVLAARTLGAKDSRLIFKHIFPNALGTVVTSSVLMIPSVIFSESSLTYLKFIDLSGSGMTSIGTMLSDGQGSYTTNPNLIIWPALFISLLMICFNIFGNGLRDAFNPTLRGAEE